jgi:hypothetical protein
MQRMQRKITESFSLVFTVSVRCDLHTRVWRSARSSDTVQLDKLALSNKTFCECYQVKLVDACRVEATSCVVFANIYLESILFEVLSSIVDWKYYSTMLFFNYCQIRLLIYICGAVAAVVSCNHKDSCLCRSYVL